VSALPKIGIMIVDDHELIRKGLQHLINGTDDLQVCGEAASVAEAVRCLELGPQPDVAIIDLSLPDVNGIELVKRLHIRHPQIRVLVSSMYSAELFAERVLAIGAMGYINKQETAERVLDAIRQIVRGETYLSSWMPERLLNVSTPGDGATTTSLVGRLTNRELEVFELIGQGVGTAEIAERMHLSIKTVQTYRAHIKRKLNLTSSLALTRSAVQWTLDALLTR
jgi:DNA-binding NarL/FixJ family response regulator